MNNNEQTDAFVMDLDNLVSRYIREFDINTYTIVGVLEDKKLELLENREVEFDVGEDFFDEDTPDAESGMWDLDSD